VQLLREIISISFPRAHHRECAVLHSRCIGKWDHQNSPLSRAKGLATLGPTPADTDLLDRRVQGQFGTTRPERLCHAQCAARQEANAEHKSLNDWAALNENQPHVAKYNLEKMTKIYVQYPNCMSKV